MSTLDLRAWISLVLLVAIMGLLIFGAAGTTEYWQAWVYLALFFSTSALVTLYLMRNDPALLARRMKGGPAAEKEARQRIIMVITSLGFIGLLVVPALDHRFGWSTVPLAAEVAGDILFVLGIYFIFLVYRENTFTSATIEVIEGQEVISTGPYAIVRHPMYASGSPARRSLSAPIGDSSQWRS